MTDATEKPRAVKVTCPECRHEVTAPPDYVGKNWRCPDCRTCIVPLADGRALLGWSEANRAGGRAPLLSVPPALRRRLLEWLVAAAAGAALAAYLLRG